MRVSQWSQESCHHLRKCGALSCLVIPFFPGGRRFSLNTKRPYSIEDRVKLNSALPVAEGAIAAEVQLEGLHAVNVTAVLVTFKIGNDKGVLDLGDDLGDSPSGVVFGPWVFRKLWVLPVWALVVEQLKD